MMEKDIGKKDTENDVENNIYMKKQKTMRRSGIEFLVEGLESDNS